MLEQNYFRRGSEFYGLNASVCVGRGFCVLTEDSEVFLGSDIDFLNHVSKLIDPHKQLREYYF